MFDDLIILDVFEVFDLLVLNEGEEGILFVVVVVNMVIVCWYVV